MERRCCKLTVRLGINIYKLGDSYKEVNKWELFRSFLGGAAEHNGPSKVGGGEGLVLWPGDRSAPITPEMTN